MPHGGDAWARMNSRPEDTMIARWRGYVVEVNVGGEVSVGERDRRGGRTSRAATSTTCYVHAARPIFEERQPKAMQMEELTDAIPREWDKQQNTVL